MKRSTKSVNKMDSEFYFRKNKLGQTFQNNQIKFILIIIIENVKNKSKLKDFNHN